MGAHADGVAVKHLIHDRARYQLDLAPELFPILRHAQFEDMLNRNFADPINGILRAIKPDEQMQCRIEIVVSPAKARRCHQAAHAVHRLDRELDRKSVV